MTKYIPLVLVLFALLKSCEKKNQIDENDLLENPKLTVSADEAINYALDFINGSSILKSTAKRKVKRTKEMSTPFAGKRIYLVEFELGGFVLMSDNLLNYPVLAYSLSDRWKYDNFSEMAPAAEEWLMNLIRLNLSIESDTALQRLNNTQAMWRGPISNSSFLKRVDPNECVDEYLGIVDHIYDNSIMSTHWRQGHPFNACWAPPYRNCSMPVGCGPVAAAQIMYFWNHPNTVSWNSMDTIYSINATETCSSPIAQLMDELIYKCNVIMSCNFGMVSVGNLTNGIEDMGYNAINADYNYNLLTQSVKAGHPVILKGARDVIHHHYWVCDGYRQIQDEYLTTCYLPSGPVSHTYTTNARAFVHLNWGWGDPNQNIWYAINNLTVPEGYPDRDYDQFMRIIHNIYPN